MSYLPKFLYFSLLVAVVYSHSIEIVDSESDDEKEHEITKRDVMDNMIGQNGYRNGPPMRDYNGYGQAPQAQPGYYVNNNPYNQQPQPQLHQQSHSPSIISTFIGIAWDSIKYVTYRVSKANAELLSQYSLLSPLATLITPFLHLLKPECH